MKLSEILIDGVPAGFSYYIDGVKVIMVAPRHRGIDVFTISSKKYCFEDQSIEAGEVVGGLGLAAFWIYDKEGSGCTLRVVVERTVTVDELVAAKRVSPTVPVEDVNQDKPSDQTELVQQLQKRLDELEKTVADLKKESTDVVKSFKFSDLLDHFSSTTGYRIYLGDNEINRYYNTPVTGIVLYDGKRLVAEFHNQDLTPLEYPSTGLMSYNVLATDGEYYNLRVTGYQVANEEEFFSK